MVNFRFARFLPEIGAYLKTFNNSVTPVRYKLATLRGSERGGARGSEVAGGRGCYN